VGPVAPASAAAWIEWADVVFEELRTEPASIVPLSTQAFDHVDHYLARWKRPNPATDGMFRWNADVDPDELEHLVYAFFTVDAHLLARVEGDGPSDVPDEARDFYVVLVRDLLHALEMESPGRAAFVEQLRWSWPNAAEAS